jgi:hypothetical protein
VAAGGTTFEQCPVGSQALHAEFRTNKSQHGTYAGQPFRTMLRDLDLITFGFYPFATVCARLAID